MARQEQIVAWAKYHGAVLLLGTQVLDLLEAVDVDGAALRHLDRVPRNGLHVDELFEARRRVVEDGTALLVVLANHSRHFGCNQT